MKCRGSWTGDWMSTNFDAHRHHSHTVTSDGLFHRIFIRLSLDFGEAKHRVHGNPGQRQVPARSATWDAQHRPFGEFHS